ncbi:hypothetical protein BX667DRAFT_495353 [Coemansia mojavensis]|nr:hypothetical protein BX667DRAFT_495353 [Coemansia mojavensis]
MFAATNISFLVSGPMFIGYLPKISLDNIYQFAFPFICAMLGILGIVCIIQLFNTCSRFKNKHCAV